MATEDEIAAVRGLLSADAAAEGWTDEKIGQMLDAGEDRDDIALQYWESRAAATSSLVDVTESGSSRKLSDVHKNALSMVKYWKSQKDEDDVAENPRRSRTRPIRRV